MRTLSPGLLCSRGSLPRATFTTCAQVTIWCSVTRKPIPAVRSDPVFRTRTVKPSALPDCTKSSAIRRNETRSHAGRDRVGYIGDLRLFHRVPQLIRDLPEKGVEIRVAQVVGFASRLIKVSEQSFLERRPAVPEAIAHRA